MTLLSSIRSPRDPGLTEVRENQWRLLQVYLFYRLLLAICCLDLIIPGTVRPSGVRFLG